jgi:hypothetical protein
MGQRKEEGQNMKKENPTSGPHMLTYGLAYKFSQNQNIKH